MILYKFFSVKMDYTLIIIMAITFAILMTSSSLGMHDEPIYSYLDGKTPLLIKIKVERRRQHQQETKRTPRQNHYRNKSSNVCPHKCSQCSPFNGCITCRPRHFLFIEWHNMRQTGRCVAQCPQSFYPKVWNPEDGPRKRHGKCSKCSVKNCERCRSKERCGRCAHPYLLHRGRCTKRCPPKTHLPHPEERRCRKLRHDGGCNPTRWSNWSGCFFKGASHCVGFQTRSRSFVQTFKSWPGGHNNLLKNFNYEEDLMLEERFKKKLLSGNKLLKRFQKIPSKSDNDLPIGDVARNSTYYDVDLYQTFKVNDVTRCPDPEYEYKKCYRRHTSCKIERNSTKHRF